ncbi:FecR family protein [Paraflavitalea sp. CAU 1676]|uniref:FecR family protein n=1 Tax=Paraflavitalea sp. CAU 1676 TaxID=3032598 RepID=UPI0023D9CA46|nr:FecR family protein [Paraflavitalea sp. CAU 1676]MDF2193714.1 FecR family protein [Paraflavitalea sp. CAU 1676]
MQHFEHYKAEDFLKEPAFIRWVLENTPKDEALWQQWLQQHPHQRNEVEEARLLLRSIKVEENDPCPEKVEEAIEQIQQMVHGRKPAPVYRLLYRWKYAAILLGAILTTGILYYKWQSPEAQSSMEANGSLPQLSTNIAEAINNSSDQEKEVRMEDGSTIRLAPHAVVRYGRHWATAGTRDVYLSGEAFFDVAKDPNKPFRVFSHELVVKVLGTSFRVKAPEKEKEFSVIVHTGKVSVYNRKNEQDRAGINAQILSGIVLKPNQQLVYQRKEEKFQKVLKEYPVLVNPAGNANNFQYENVPVAEVLEEIKAAYGIDIAYDKETISHCRITADLSNESIYKKLDLICMAMEARYNVIDGEVSLLAKPCE